MTTSQARAKSDISDLSSPLSKGDLAYLRAQSRNLLHELVLTEFFRLQDQKGFTKTDLATRSGHDKASITRWLRSPKNLQIETVSDLLAAMGGYLEPKFVCIGDQPVKNRQQPDWTDTGVIRIPTDEREGAHVSIPKPSSTAREVDLVSSDG